MREGGSATIRQRCAVLGDLTTVVRSFKVGTPERYAQYPVTVSIRFVGPRKRRAAYYRVLPDNLRYLLIIGTDGRLLYDSRHDVPCDMEKWTATRAKHKSESEQRRIEEAEFRAQHPLPPGVTVQTDFADFADYVAPPLSQGERAS